MKRSKGRLLLSIVIVFIAVIICIRAYNKSKDIDDERVELSLDGGALESFSSGVSYFDYLYSYADAKNPDTVINIPCSDFIYDEDAKASITSYKGMDEVLYWDSQQGNVTFEFEVLEEGLYNLGFYYCPISIKGNNIQLGIKIDGDYPYKSVETISLPRLFLDETYKNFTDNEFRRDSIGNEIRPTADEKFIWQKYTVIDGNGQYTGALMFYLSKGVHTLTLNMQMEGVAIHSMFFYQEDTVAAYKDVLASWELKGASDTSGYELIFQAEKSYYKSHNILFATFDKSSASIMPSSAHNTLYNTIGRSTWESAGQYISWEVEVPEDGYYNLAFKVKQNTKRGMYSIRDLMIDGEVLFKEMENVKFEFANSWYIKVFNDNNKEPYKIYLTKGKHVLRMTVDIGDVSDILRKVDKTVEELNAWYREIVKIVGSNADAYRITIDANRDFLLDKKIPGLMDGFLNIQKTLESVMEDIKVIDGIEATSATVVSEAIALMKSFIKTPGKIANRIETYRGVMSSLATWTVEMRAQPLEMDYFVLYSPDVKTPKIKTSFFKQLSYRFTMFIDSFTTDYNSLGSTMSGDTQKKPLTVWISTADMAGTGGIASGRDQAILLKRLIEDMFTPVSKISVNVSLVNSSSTLTQAVLAGKGPDIALFVTKETPVNLAMRGALYDLSSFDDFDEVISQFMPSAIIPYEYRGKYYALPETQSYDMLFYRKDIFEQLGLLPPDTWKDFYALIPVLMEDNFIVGIPESQRTFEMLLYQYGGTFYNSELTKTAFDTKEALRAFEDWTGLYAKYSLPLVFDFFNRFRTGEMPMAIMPYTQVNYLEVAAPELKNQWGIAPVPGTLQEDGTINRSETSNGTACIIMSDTKQPDDAYEFLKWWVSTEVQSRFGIELEQNMGPAARYPTANVDAFSQLPWTKEQSISLMEQWKNVTEIPQIPGNYYISRNISFAFRAVVHKKENERESLYRYNKEINKEIERKMKEFELSK